jgi:hypothetical protein
MTPPSLLPRLLAALLACTSAAAHHIHIIDAHPGPASHGTPPSSISPAAARLVLAQRLDLGAHFAVGDGIDDAGLAAINALGGFPPSPLRAGSPAIGYKGERRSVVVVHGAERPEDVLPRDMERWRSFSVSPLPHRERTEEMLDELHAAMEDAAAREVGGAAKTELPGEPWLRRINGRDIYYARKLGVSLFFGRSGTKLTVAAGWARVWDQQPRVQAGSGRGPAHHRGAPERRVADRRRAAERATLRRVRDVGRRAQITPPTREAPGGAGGLAKREARSRVVAAVPVELAGPLHEQDGELQRPRGLPPRVQRPGQQRRRAAGRLRVRVQVGVWGRGLPEGGRVSPLLDPAQHDGVFDPDCVHGHRHAVQHGERGVAVGHRRRCDGAPGEVRLLGTAFRVYTRYIEYKFLH